MSDTEPFEAWALIEVMGHSRYAGKVSNQAIGGCNFVRVDVPSVGECPAFTKLLGQSSIFAITLVDEATARRAAERWQVVPFVTFSAPALPAPRDYGQGYDEEDDPLGDDE